jgi:hypothetical protein
MSTMLASVERGYQTAGIHRSSWRFVVVSALVIAVVACALGRVTFQSGSDAWRPFGADAGSFVGQ